MSELRLSTLLNELIEKSTLTKTQLAERAGISRASLYNMLSGDVAESKLSTLARLASALGVHPFDIIHPYFNKSTRGKLATTHQAGTAFVEDVSYPDFSSVMPYQTFVKTWAVMNTGTVPWENLFLVCQDVPVEIGGMIMGLQPEEPRIAIPYTRPGEKLLLSVTLTAPGLPCTVKSEWKAAYANGELLFPDKRPLYCIVKVCSW